MVQRQATTTGDLIGEVDQPVLGLERSIVGDQPQQFLALVHLGEHDLQGITLPLVATAFRHEPVENLLEAWSLLAMKLADLIDPDQVLTHRRFQRQQVADHRGRMV